MKYINVSDEIYTDPNVGYRTPTGFKPATPEALSPNLKEWFIHYVLRKHFTFGQPYCVVCMRKAQNN